MQYPNVHLAKFIDRPNRFIAHCQLIDTGEVVTTHVKNTGRTTILQPGVTTALVHNDNPNRKPGMIWWRPKNMTGSGLILIRKLPIRLSKPVWRPITSNYPAFNPSQR